MKSRIFGQLIKHFFKHKNSLSRMSESLAADVVPSVEKREHVPTTDEEHPPKRLKEDNPTNDDGERLKKKKVALLLSYSGKGYYGMQVNQGFRTIESDLMEALYKAGVIPQEHKDNPNKMQFQRAARTDKGVSAAMQVVSLKMSIDLFNFKMCYLWVNVTDALKKINENLPPQIRVIDFKRTTQGFNCKNSCSHRTYSYFLPTYAFTPVEEFVLQAFRLPEPESFTVKANEVLELFKGTHNFHNFTSGKKPDEQSAKRYIIDMQCCQPFVQDGIEWAVITVKGQSFMLHQIRKMVGVFIAIMRGLATEDVINKAWTTSKVDIPKAPGLGLMLEQVHYDSYNKRFGFDGIHDPLIWDDHKDFIENFKKDFIYSTMMETEKEEKTMFKWLSTLFSHHFDYRKDVELPVESETAVGRAAHQVTLDDKRKATELQDKITSENTAISAVNSNLNNDDIVERYFKWKCP